MAKLRVRARAVDMLGRQQIAGIPTAIHELFKNAHDAYAERAEVDYFRRTKVMIIRDDGYGMTRKDVEDRWLTLGTESRIKLNSEDPIKNWTGPKKFPSRMIMGEKGIGRLAIAVIAPITLLLTRAVRPEGFHNLVVALVHWGLFEQPSIDIGMIDIPIVEFPGGQLPSSANINKLINQLKGNIEELKSELSNHEFDRLNDELEKVRKISPIKLDSTLSQFVTKGESHLSLTKEGYGTHFILLPTAPELDDDIDGGSDKDAGNLERFLLGFSNTMTGDEPVIKTEFRDHHLDDEPRELIGPKNFFLHEEFHKADHHFEGEFDEYGQFNGTVRIYGEKHPFVCNWPEGRGRPVRCGSFSINFAYIMGKSAESQLNPTDHKTMIDKLERLGGLYIYRNNIRVLPYGNTDYDFLEIEKRRTKSAQDWFFSYRRIMGYIAITQDENFKLNEKAGREGFRQNQAYRDFRTVLINLFQRLAFEYFRDSAPQGEAYWEKKEQISAEAALLTKQKKKADARRKEFQKLLEVFFNDYEANKFASHTDRIKRIAESRLNKLLDCEDEGDFAVGLRELEEYIQNRFQKIENYIVISKPRGLALSKRLEKDWMAYQRIYPEIREKVIDANRRSIDEMIRKATAERIGEAQLREVAMELLEKQKSSLLRELSALRNSTYAAQDHMRNTLKDVIREEFSNLRKSLEIQMIEFTKYTAQKPSALKEARNAVEREISRIREKETSLLEAIKRQMNEFSEGIKERETLDDRVGALEQRNQRLEEQLEFYSDFAQMGMAVGILQHEFEKTARDMRMAMRNIKPWADGTPELKKTYIRLRKSFDHIDGYFKLLDPLGRRLKRTSIKISGEEIRNHLFRIFRKVLEEEDIAFKTTNAFISKTVKCHSSALLGAFINIVDNAIYWVANGAKDKRIIKLDADDSGFLISNTGPGIEERLSERIFEFGETTKPGGRGMGLSISRDALQKEGFVLELIQDGLDKEPVFKIITSSSEMGEEDDDE